MAEASFEKARKAFEKFIAGAQSAADSLSARTATVGAGAKDISATAFSCAEKNVQTSLDFLRALLHAKDLSEVMRLQREYVQALMRLLAEQASEMGQIASRTAMDAVVPKTMYSQYLKRKAGGFRTTGRRNISIILWQCTGDFVALHKNAMIVCLYLERPKRAFPSQ